MPYIADFGVSKVIDSQVDNQMVLSRIHSNIRWQAPELIQLNDDDDCPKPTAESDTYAFAWVCYEVVV
jgi:serine/threonine protein kinase